MLNNSMYKNKISHSILRLQSKVNKFSYFTYETALALFRKKKIRILFSKQDDREGGLKKSFRLLRHKITFDELTYENVKKNDLIVPLSLYDIRLLIMNPELTRDNPIPMPTMESLDICDDKYLFYETLTEKGFEKDMPRIGKALKMPYMVKKKVAYMGLNCYIIDTPEKETQYKAEINDPDYFCQEIVLGPKEYATHLLYIGGKFVSVLNVVYTFPTATYVKGRDKFICTKLCRCPHLELFSKMLDAIGFEGLCCFNYKEIDGKPLVFEINPRFGGSLTMYFFSFLKHLKFPETYAKQA
jgi:hypothetical protein